MLYSVWAAVFLTVSLIASVFNAGFGWSIYDGQLAAEPESYALTYPGKVFNYSVIAGLLFLFLFLFLAHAAWKKKRGRTMIAGVAITLIVLLERLLLLAVSS